MKKVIKFVCSIAAGAAAGFGAYCVYKNVLAKKNAEDCDDFDDCFDEDVTEETDENREYVSINITEEETVPDEADETEETTEETVEETPAKEVTETEEA